MLDDLSIIIPIGPGEMAWQGLLSDLKSLAPNAELLLIGADAPSAEFVKSKAALRCDARWLQSEPGRARQLNRGASAAARRFLWFLHADSRIERLALEKLEWAIRREPGAIHYFKLAFQPDGPLATRLNAWGANLRSHFFRLPFGDQGFCLSKKQFWCLGGFDESLRLGEDHLFIWQAHRKGVPVRPVAAKIVTSARKYSRDGWLRTTCNHLFQTGRQAIPQLARLLIAQGAQLANKRQSHSGGERLIVFTRCPESGQCKTRLIPALGAEGAAAVHESLVRRTMSWMGIAVDEGVTVEVRYSGNDLDRLRALCGHTVDRLHFRPQQNGDLGERLMEALETAFNEGASKVAIIGTDCPDLCMTAISRAFVFLEDKELVLGPASDGGYYLIAMRTPASKLFDRITWGGASVLQETLSTAETLQMSVALLPVLADIDRPEDLKHLAAEESQD
jgi:rSAM/selenodomain-associated transferase 1